VAIAAFAVGPEMRMVETLGACSRRPSPGMVKGR
jgi:hypothetical protein